MIKLSDRNQMESQERLQKAMREEGVDGLILTEAGAILSATGHYSCFQRYALVSGYTIAVLPVEGKFTVIMPDYEMPFADNPYPDLNIETVTTGIFVDELEKITGGTALKERPATVDGNQTYRMALDILTRKKPDARIGLQLRSITADAMDFFRQNAGGCTFFDCAPLLNRANMIKTKWEIDVLRYAAQASERAMNAAAAAVKEGMSVAEVVYLFFRNCMIETGPNVTGAHPTTSVGTGYSPFEIPPEKSVKKGDIIRLDSGPFYFGYISDICRNYSVGPASDKAKRIYAALMKGLDRELELIGPGVKIADVFNEVQETVRKAGIPNYVRGHLGHSIGTYCEEYPYISPYNGDEVFRPGMVVSVEIPYNNPFIGGLTPEDSLLITENGYELFTHVPHEIVEL